MLVDEVGLFVWVVVKTVEVRVLVAELAFKIVARIAYNIPDQSVLVLLSQGVKHGSDFSVWFVYLYVLPLLRSDKLKRRVDLCGFVSENTGLGARR